MSGPSGQQTHGCLGLELLESYSTLALSLVGGLRPRDPLCLLPPACP